MVVGHGIQGEIIRRHMDNEESRRHMDNDVRSDVKWEADLVLNLSPYSANYYLP